VPYTKNERALLAVCWVLILGGPAYCTTKSIQYQQEAKKVRVTMSAMRDIAAAWEARASDLGRYNAAGQEIAFVESGARDRKELRHVITAAQLRDLLQPAYMKRDFPMRDGWGHEWRLAMDRPYPGSSDSPAGSYAIASPGRDGRFGAMVDGNVPCAAWECDIVFSNGQFVTKFPAADSD
jgi:hypothetical protein